MRSREVAVALDANAIPSPATAPPASHRSIPPSLSRSPYHRFPSRESGSSGYP